MREEKEEKARKEAEARIQRQEKAAAKRQLEAEKVLAKKRMDELKNLSAQVELILTPRRVEPRSDIPDDVSLADTFLAVDGPLTTQTTNIPSDYNLLFPAIEATPLSKPLPTTPTFIPSRELLHHIPASQTASFNRFQKQVPSTPTPIFRMSKACATSRSKVSFESAEIREYNPQDTSQALSEVMDTLSLSSSAEMLKRTGKRAVTNKKPNRRSTSSKSTTKDAKNSTEGSVKRQQTTPVPMRSKRGIKPTRTVSNTVVVSEVPKVVPAILKPTRSGRVRKEQDWIAKDRQQR